MAHDEPVDDGALGERDGQADAAAAGRGDARRHRPVERTVRDREGVVQGAQPRADGGHRSRRLADPPRVDRRQARASPAPDARRRTGTGTGKCSLGMLTASILPLAPAAASVVR